MMWQMWTAFGIMLGFLVSVAFQNVRVIGNEYSPWRWMLASTAIPPMFVMAQVYFCPESPRCVFSLTLIPSLPAPRFFPFLQAPLTHIYRWYMEKGKYDKAFHAFTRLRKHKLQAARDMYYAYKMLEIEAGQREGKNLVKEMFTVKRNRRAAQSAFFVMFMQQFCGVSIAPPPQNISHTN
jgi:MFS family permease